MGDPDGGICRIDTLSSVAGGTIDINPQIIRINVDLHLFCLGKDSYSNCGGMNPPLGFSNGNSLHAMYTTFVFQDAVCTLTFYKGDDFLESTHATCRIAAYNIYLPSAHFCILGVHAEKISHEEPRLITAGSCPDFEKHILVIVRVFGKEEQFQFILQELQFLLELRQFFLDYFF